MNPDIVAIQLRGNDIAATSSPNDIFQTLLELQTDLQTADIKEVYFAGKVARGNFGKSPGLTATSFDKQRNKINRLMKTRLNYIKLRVKFQQDYDRDLVHFNNSGLRTQFLSLRRPFFRC
ncbi:hypothetical protein KP79_PYT24699 [Mizuhopecten yessoensis]|uniref:SGNH hydrolase-type esterase domain-containing protein n=1 Tax=Mizuhopecten yessoensis TaxID=6573 RepID=A0A210QPS2_MIZYE|nr:hypothetical protein KP79_PYT24699 [Mizuhopecten yessoensis]